MNTPDSIKEFSTEYKNKSWEEYEPQELGMWVHLLLKRAGHRTSRDKRDKDILGAQNYLDMLQEHINWAAEQE